MVAALRTLSAGVGIAGTLKKLNGVNSADFPELAELALHDSCMDTNPIQPTKEDVVMVYQMAYEGLGI